MGYSYNNHMIKNLSYREAIPDDIESLIELTCFLARETEKSYLNKEIVRAGIENLFDSVEGRKVFVAEEIMSNSSTQLVGFLSVTGREWSEWENGLFIFVGSAYIREPFRKMGIAKELYNKAEKYSKSQGAIGIRTSVRLDNAVSINAQYQVGLRSTGYILNEHLFQITEEAS